LVSLIVVVVVNLMFKELLTWVWTKVIDCWIWKAATK
jgi:hypothetical protein